MADAFRLICRAAPTRRPSACYDTTECRWRRFACKSPFYCVAFAITRPPRLRKL